jgi:hypothetical protein
VRVQPASLAGAHRRADLHRSSRQGVPCGSKPLPSPARSVVCVFIVRLSFRGRRTGPTRSPRPPAPWCGWSCGPPRSGCAVWVQAVAFAGPQRGVRVHRSPSFGSGCAVRVEAVAVAGADARSGAHREAPRGSFSRRGRSFHRRSRCRRGGRRRSLHRRGHAWSCSSRAPGRGFLSRVRSRRSRNRHPGRSSRWGRGRGLPRREGAWSCSSRAPGAGRVSRSGRSPIPRRRGRRWSCSSPASDPAASAVGVDSRPLSGADMGGGVHRQPPVRQPSGSIPDPSPART